MISFPSTLSASSTCTSRERGSTSPRRASEREARSRFLVSSHRAWLLGSKTRAGTPAPKSGRYQRSVGEVYSTCSICSRTCSRRALSPAPAAETRKGNVIYWASLKRLMVASFFPVSSTSSHDRGLGGQGAHLPLRDGRGGGRSRSGAG